MHSLSAQTETFSKNSINIRCSSRFFFNLFFFIITPQGKAYGFGGVSHMVKSRFISLHNHLFAYVSVSDNS